MKSKHLKCYEIFRNGTQQGTINAYSKKEAEQELFAMYGKNCCSVIYSHRIN